MSRNSLGVFGFLTMAVMMGAAAGLGPPPLPRARPKRKCQQCCGDGWTVSVRSGRRERIECSRCNGTGGEPEREAGR